MTTARNPVKNLSISGGGVKICAMAGAITGLEKKHPGFLKDLKRVAGASAGAITAFMISAGYTADEISSTMRKINFKNIPNTRDPLIEGYDLISHDAIYSATGLENVFLDLMKAKGFNANTTFADLKKKGFADLYIVTTKIFKNGSNYYRKRSIHSDETNPDSPILPILVASASIPLVFPPKKFKSVTLNNPEDKEHPVKILLTEDPNGIVNVDGGYVDNFPEDIFDEPGYLESPPANPDVKKIFNHETLGLRLCTTAEVDEAKNDQFDEEPISTSNLVTYVAEIGAAALESGLTTNFGNSKDTGRTYFVDDCGVSSTDWNITEELINKLDASGQKAIETQEPAIFRMSDEKTSEQSRLPSSKGPYTPYLKQNLFRPMMVDAGTQTDDLLVTEAKDLATRQTENAEQKNEPGVTSQTYSRSGLMKMCTIL